MGYDIQQVDTPSAPESLLVELADYYVIVEAEDMPGDPPTPHEVQIDHWRHVESRHPVPRWILRDDHGIAAAAVAYYSLDHNLENGFGRVHVHPDKRDRGYARALATPLFDHLEGAGRHRFDTWVKDGDPAEALTEKLGLKKVYADKRSRLVIADLDMDLMRSWIERAPERASDYELVYYMSPFPEELVQPFCDLQDVMNTAPREDFEAEDEVLTPEDRRIERILLELEALKVGPSTDPDADFGPLVTPEALEKVRSYVDIGVKEGAELVVDGRSLTMQGYGKGFFMGPCLFDRVTPDMTIYKEEIFGPVLSVVRAKNYDEALRLPSEHEYGNGVAIFTRDGDAARDFAAKVDTGMVGINVPIPVPLAFHSFGGWKRSLFGDHHIHGPEGVRFYTRLKTVTARWPTGIRSGAEFVMPTMK